MGFLKTLLVPISDSSDLVALVHFWQGLSRCVVWPRAIVVLAFNQEEAPKVLRDLID